MPPHEPLLSKHGGYRHLKSFQVSQLVYDVTVRFCDLYIGKRSRTHDQMVQAARSGVQNIAEGSMASATSKKTELKLTSVARASLEELRLDYEDFLRQRNLPQWSSADPRRAGLVALRPATADAVAAWAREVHDEVDRISGHRGQGGHLGHREIDRPHVNPDLSMKSTVSTQSTYPEIVANGALVLINVASALLGRQIKTLAENFEQEGGFTEKLFRVRTACREKL